MLLATSSSEELNVVGEEHVDVSIESAPPTSPANVELLDVMACVHVKLGLVT